MVARRVCVCRSMAARQRTGESKGLLLKLRRQVDPSGRHLSTVDLAVVIERLIASTRW
jgi:hypothetical protein